MQTELHLNDTQPKATSTALMNRVDCVEGTEHLFEQLNQKDVSKLQELFNYHNAFYEQIRNTAHFLNSGLDSAFNYLVEGNLSGDRARMLMSTANTLSNSENGIKALNATCWNRAIELTDVLSTLPSNRRKEWNEQITTHSTPNFEQDIVIDTLVSLLNERTKFFAERVVNVFEGLSNTHVTNSPSGFTQKFIMNNLLQKASGSYEWWHLNYDQAGKVDDLRVLVNQITGRLCKTATFSNTNQILNKMVDNKMFGEFLDIDGGAIKIKLFKKGTAHFMIEPSIAATLNNNIAKIYPMAIPSEFRRKPKKANKVWDKPIDTSLSVQAVDCLLSMRHKFKDEVVSMFTGSNSETGLKEAHNVLIQLGADYHNNSRNLDFGKYYFDYDVAPVLLNICISGRVPEKQSHQYYPTPDELSEEAAAELDIQDGDICIESSAGQGGLATHLPIDSTLIDISPMNCDVLKAKGFTNVICDDFLAWARQNPTQQFTAALINPPFHKGMAKAHIEATAKLLTDKGRMVAVAPSTLNNLEIEGFEIHAGSPRTVRFEGATVNVILLKIERI
mgnify:CR=1 FL=1